MRTPILPRLFLALGITVSVLAAAFLLAPPEHPVWVRARTLLPAVLFVTLMMEWVADRNEGFLHRMTTHLRSLWDNGAGGLYGAIAAGTFVELEIRTVIAEASSAGSAGQWLREQAGDAVVGFSTASIMNLVEASIWFVAWLDHLSIVEMALLGLACFATYALGRWAWPDRDGQDALFPVSGGSVPSE